MIDLPVAGAIRSQSSLVVYTDAFINGDSLTLTGGMHNQHHSGGEHHHSYTTAVANRPQTQKLIIHHHPINHGQYYLDGYVGIFSTRSNATYHHLSCAFAKPCTLFLCCWIGA
jgi:hypothetical protein